MSFNLSVDPSRSVSTGGTTLQRCGEALLDKLLAHSPNRRVAHLQGLADVFIRPAWSDLAGIGFEQNARVQQFPRCCLPCRNHLKEKGSLVCGKLHNVFLVHFFLLELVR
jgi:hypothetical protein